MAGSGAPKTGPSPQSGLVGDWRNRDRKRRGMSPETLYTMGGKGGKQSVDQPRNTNLGCSFYPPGRDCGFNKAGGGTCGTKLPVTGE